jgi:hypothetical protein
MRFTIILGALALLLLGACDRFEHSFEPETPQEHVITANLRQALESSSAEDMSPLLEIYSEDYRHNGITRAERMDWYYGFLAEEGIRFEVNELDYALNPDNAGGFLNWQLRILQGETVLADSSFYGEQMRWISGDYWVLEGNKVCIQETKQMVIAEYFTFDSCPYCPPAEAKLHELQDLHPNFIYLEHHITGDLQVQGNDTPAYYSAFSAPTAVFQGQFVVNGSSATALADYEAIVAQQAELDTPIIYTISLEPITNLRELSAIISLTLQDDLSLEDVYLNYVLITDDVSQTNIQGDPLHNVVRAVGRTPLEGADLSQIPINLTLQEDLPLNSSLVVYAQYRPDNFENNAIIHGGAMYNISQDGVKK